MAISVEGVRRWQWPADILPLSHERFPFANIADEAISGYLDFLALFPEAYGRLGRFVRTQLGISLPCPVRYIFWEAHIDINEANTELTNYLVKNGFEPDHFASLNPPEYRKCFTARFEIPLERTQRSREISSHLLHLMPQIEKKVMETPGRFAYSEVECYTHKNKIKIPFRPVLRSALRDFPFREGQFSRIVTGPKKMDLHVKLPTSDKGSGFEHASSDAMLMLRQLFIMAGFYEIRSLSGNVIYTLQMVDGLSAVAAFRRISKWCSEHGGAISIELEICTRFWRSVSRVANREFLAPIPLVVSEV